VTARPRESAFIIAEQFGLDQAFRQSRTIDRHERLVTARTVSMNLAGEDLLADAGFTLE
jgi:hypothetical protein